MQLSKRLLAVAALASEAERIADIGTDHGYIPIYLCRQGKLKSAVAMDVNIGPLERAGEHIRQYGLENVITTRLSDGASKLQPHEVDTAVIAGMGGPLTIRILTNGKEVFHTIKTLVLQPQSEIPSVRQYLLENGYVIIDEDMIEEDGKFYPMMKAVYEGVTSLTENPKADRENDRKADTKNAGRTDTENAGKAGGEANRETDTVQEVPAQTRTTWTEGELQFGKFLIEKKDPCLKKFLDLQEQKCTKIIADLKEKNTPAAQEGIRLNEEKLRLIRAVKLDF